MAHIKTSKSGQRLLTFTDVAERLAVGKSTVYSLVSRGDLPVVEFGAGSTGRGCTRFRECDIEDFIETRLKRRNFSTKQKK